MFCLASHPNNDSASVGVVHVPPDPAAFLGSEPSTAQGAGKVQSAERGLRGSLRGDELPGGSQGQVHPVPHLLQRG